MANFTPEEISEILAEFFDTAGKRQYVGARYVPIFGRKNEDSIAWDNSDPYEPLTIVLYQGNSYTSRTYVPAGVAISNTTYWALTGNYNAQIEQYRTELEAIRDGYEGIKDALPITAFDSTYTVKEYVDNAVSTINGDIESIENIIPAASFDSTDTVKKYIDDSVAEISDILPSTDFDSTNTVKKYVDDSVTEISNVLPYTDFDSTNTVKKYVDDSVAEISAVLPSTDFDSTNTVKKYVDDEIMNAYQNAVNNRNHEGAFNIIGEFDLSDYGSVQGCTWIEGDNYVVGCSVTGSNNVNLFKWNAKTHTLVGPTLVAGYHDNSMTYVPDLDELYICEAFDDADWNVLIPTITVVKYSTMTFQRRITVPMQESAEGIYGLAYDRENEIFYATCWRGSTEGQSNRIYKYDKTLTEYLGAFNLDDYTSRYFITSSNQGVQYVYDNTLFEIYYDFGLIVGFDTATGNKKIIFNVPEFANDYRFVGELEGFAINEETKAAICFTGSGAFECGIYKDVFADKISPATTNIHANPITALVYGVSPLDTTPTTISKKFRSFQDGINYGTITRAYVRVAVAESSAVNNIRNTIYVYNFCGDLQFGAVSNPNTIPQGIKIVGSNVVIWGGIITGRTSAIFGLDIYGSIVLYNSTARIFGLTLNCSTADTHGICLFWKSTLAGDISTAQWNGKSLYANNQNIFFNYKNEPPSYVYLGDVAAPNLKVL